MRSFAVLSAAGLAAAQFTSIVITDGITATLTLPVFPEPTPSVTVTEVVPETTVTVSPEPTPSTTVTVSEGTSTVAGGITTTTIVVVSDPPVTATTAIVIPSVSVSDPVVTLPTFSLSDTTISLPTITASISASTLDPASTVTAVVPSVNTTLATLTQTHTSFPNATSTGPVTVPTAAADKLQSSVAGLVAFGIASFFLL